MSLSYRKNCKAHLPFVKNNAFFADVRKARLPDAGVSGLQLRSLSLRPGGLLTVLETALSMGFRRSITLPPAIQATRLRAFVMVGLLFLQDAHALSGRTLIAHQES